VVKLFLLLLIITAALLGWWLGKQGTIRRISFRRNPVRDDYFRGLNYLLNEQADEAIDTFINSLEVTPQTLETHLALGSMMRRRGEVDRAIKVHQNLLSRPKIPLARQYQAQLELARDFLKAGLLDRAERLLLDLVGDSEEYCSESLRHLIEIYRDEHEWDKAIRVAQKLNKNTFRPTPPQAAMEMAHFHCELAEIASQKGDNVAAKNCLDKALAIDKSSVRASILSGKLALNQGDYQQAIKCFLNVPEQDHEFTPEVVEPLCECYAKQDLTVELVRQLKSLLETNRSSNLLVKLADKLEVTEGKQAAIDLLAEALSAGLSLRGLKRLLELESPTGDEAPASFAPTKNLLEQLLVARPGYRCEHCGFSGNQLHWLCPKCLSWSTIKPLLDVEE